jgi:hypothetical protein
VEASALTDGAGFMDPALKTLKAALEAIRDTTMNALAQIGQSQEEYSMRWTLKHFRPIL